MIDTGKYVINFYPSPSCSPTKDTYTQYCKYALMKYFPWQDDPVNSYGGENETDEEVQNKWIQFLHSLGDDIPDLLQRELDQYAATRNDDGNHNVPLQGDDSFRSDEALIPSQEDHFADVPNLPQIIQDRLLDDIDSADIDWDDEHDWSIPTHEYDLPSLRDSLAQFKESDVVRTRREIQYCSLNNRQKKAHDMIESSCLQGENESSTDGGDGIGRLQILLGAGGCGKSHVIDAVLTTLTSTHHWTYEDFSVHATTGKAATNIWGSTFQNFKDGLGFYGTSYSPLSSSLLGSFQQRMKNKKLIILDEFSMLRQYEIAYINRRLKEVMVNDKPFGGLTIVLAGDPGQLPPVKGNSLWSKARNGSANWEGLCTYSLFTTVMRLTENMRLDRTDPEAVRYEEFLVRNRDGANTIDDWEYITRLCSEHSMPQHEWEDFKGDDVIHLYSTNKEVAARNADCLKRLDSPIVKVNALHTGDGRKGSSSLAHGLDSHAFFCKGALILLTKNIWQSAGICNGATGKIIDIIYAEDTPPPGLPECIIVDFEDSYSGPSFFPDFDDRRGWVPIFPQTSEWSTVKDGETANHSRTMFALRLCYAWTIWKVQGQTLRSKVVAHLGEVEKEHGLSYTVFSRVTKPSNLGLIGGLSRERLTQKILSQAKMKPRMKEEKRLEKFVRKTLAFLNRM